MKQRFLQGTAYSAGGMIYSTVALLAAGKLLTNALTPEAVGQFALLLLCAEFLGMLANCGLPATVPKLIQSRDGTARVQLLNSLFAFQLAAAFAVSALCGIAAVFGRHWLPSVESWLPLPLSLLCILPVLLVAAAFRDFLLACAAGQHDYRRRAGAIALMSTLQVIFFAALYLGEPESPLPFAGSYLFAVAGGATLLARRIPRGGPVDWRGSWACVRFSIPLFVNYLLNFIYQRADTLLVIYFLGLNTAALFEMAKRIPGALSRFFVSALIPYLPSVAELLRAGEREDAARLLQRVSVYVAFAGYVMTLGAVAIQEPLLHLLFTTDYGGAAPVLGPLLIAACLSVQAGVMGQALIALERPHWIMVINVGLAGLGFGLNLILLPQMGLAGAGWSAVVAALFSFVLQYLAVARAGIVVPPGRGVLVHVFFVLAYAAIHGMNLSPWASAAVAASYGVLILATGAVAPSDLRAMLRKEAP